MKGVCGRARETGPGGEGPACCACCFRLSALNGVRIRAGPDLPIRTILCCRPIYLHFHALIQPAWLSLFRTRARRRFRIAACSRRRACRSKVFGGSKIILSPLHALSRPSAADALLLSSFRSRDCEPAMSPLPALPRSYSRVTLRERPRASIDPKLDGTGTFQYEKDVQLWSADQLKAGEAVVKVEWVSRSRSSFCVPRSGVYSRSFTGCTGLD